MSDETNHGYGCAAGLLIIGACLSVVILTGLRLAGVL
jgi:hypothetical protein